MNLEKLNVVKDIINRSLNAYNKRLKKDLNKINDLQLVKDYFTVYNKSTNDFYAKVMEKLKDIT